MLDEHAAAAAGGRWQRLGQPMSGRRRIPLSPVRKEGFFEHETVHKNSTQKYKKITVNSSSSSCR
jgi:hypothetical protein